MVLCAKFAQSIIEIPTASKRTVLSSFYLNAFIISVFSGIPATARSMNVIGCCCCCCYYYPTGRREIVHPRRKIVNSPSCIVPPFRSNRQTLRNNSEKFVNFAEYTHTHTRIRQCVCAARKYIPDTSPMPNLFVIPV